MVMILDAHRWIATMKDDDDEYSTRKRTLSWILLLPSFRSTLPMMMMMMMQRELRMLSRTFPNWNTHRGRHGNGLQMKKSQTTFCDNKPHNSDATQRATIPSLPPLLSPIRLPKWKEQVYLLKRSWTQRNGVTLKRSSKGLWNVYSLDQGKQLRSFRFLSFLATCDYNSFILPTFLRDFISLVSSFFLISCQTKFFI